MLLFTGKGAIKNASVIGSHEIEVYQDRIIANDTGGIFVSAKKTEAFFNKDKVKLNIKLGGLISGARHPHKTPTQFTIIHKNASDSV